MNETFWQQLTIVFITFIALYIWNRIQSKKDAKRTSDWSAANRDLVSQIHQENQEIIKSLREMRSTDKSIDNSREIQ